MNEDEKEELIDGRALKLSEFTDRWIEYSEYVTIEFDTEAGTAVVVPND